MIVETSPFGTLQGNTNRQDIHTEYSVLYRAAWYNQKCCLTKGLVNWWVLRVAGDPERSEGSGVDTMAIVPF